MSFWRPFGVLQNTPAAVPTVNLECSRSEKGVRTRNTGHHECLSSVEFFFSAGKLSMWGSKTACSGKGEEFEGRGTGLCNEDIVVLGQSFAKSLLNTLTHAENAPVKL